MTAAMAAALVHQALLDLRAAFRDETGMALTVRIDDVAQQLDLAPPQRATFCDALGFFRCAGDESDPGACVGVYYLAIAAGLGMRDEEIDRRSCARIGTTPIPTEVPRLHS